MKQNNKNINIPIPPEPPEIKVSNSEFITKIYKIRKKTPFLYLLCVLNIILAIGINFYFYLNKMLLAFIFGCFISFPIVALSLLFIFIRFFVYDFKKVKKLIVVKLTHNFILLEIFKQGRRINQIVGIINKDGKTISDGKKEYTLDNNAVWFDTEGYPHIFVLDNLPNPVLFGFEKDLNNYVRNISIKGEIPDNKGLMIDVSYSSENLQLLKKDKIFSELHRNPEQDKIIIGLMVLIGVIMLVFLIIILVKK